MKTSLIALGTVLGLTAPAYAEGADPAEGSADSTILVVGQQDTPITVVPRGLSVSLGQEEFDAVNALNVEDLMKYAPNFFVRKRFAGDDNAVVALRGANTIQSARTIVMVDGFVVSNFLGNRWDFPPKALAAGFIDDRQDAELATIVRTALDKVVGPHVPRIFWAQSDT